MADIKNMLDRYGLEGVNKPKRQTSGEIISPARVVSSIDIHLTTSSLEYNCSSF